MGLPMGQKLVKSGATGTPTLLSTVIAVNISKMAAPQSRGEPGN